jgi:hypothetical protein
MKLSDRGLVYYNTQECAGMNNKTLKKDRSCTLVSRKKFDKGNLRKQVRSVRNWSMLLRQHHIYLQN